MRLRIQTKAPLPELKAWYTPDSETAPETVSELKNAICQNVQTLRASGVSGYQVLLLLDDFQLLDDSPLDVVRDGDLICIKMLPGLFLKPDTKSQGNE